MEREWREASDARPSLVALAVVLAVAAVLRFWTLSSGIPYAVGIDEPQIMTRVVHMMQTGDFNPHFFDYPSLYLYLQLFVACIRFVLGATAGLWDSLHHVTDGDFYLWGRVVTASLGTATVYLVYLIGRRWGTRHALLAAGLMAVMPNHVRESHFVLTDVPMTFFVVLSFTLALRALEKPTARAFAWAGAAAGLAAATKYYGGSVLVVPLLAAYFASESERPRIQLALYAIGAAAASFLIAAPYTVLDLPGFLNGFATLAGAFRGRMVSAEPGWLIYLKHLSIGLSAGGYRWTSYCAMLLLAWGLVHAIVRGFGRPMQPRFVMLSVFPLLYFALVSDRTLIYARYLMPLFPFVALLIAIAIVSGVTLLRRFNMPRPARTSLIVALTVVALLPPLIASLTWDIVNRRPSTYSYAYKWILQNVRHDEGVIVEGGIFTLPVRYRTKAVRRFDQEFGPAVTTNMRYAVLMSGASGQLFESARLDPSRYVAFKQIVGRMSLAAAFRNPPDGMAPDIWIFRLADEPVEQTPAVTTVARPVK